MQDRQYQEARLLRQSEPYAHQRNRQIGNKQPRPAQPNTYQPNRLPALQGWGGTTREYWESVFSNYLKRRISPMTGLALGRL